MISAVAVSVTLVLITSFSSLPNFADADADGIADANDNCPDFPNPLQEDINGNEIGDDCDLDDDNDQVVDAID